VIDFTNNIQYNIVVFKFERMSYVDSLITLALLCLLFSVFLYRAKLYPEGNPGFFNVENTKAMRAFWSIIVVLVHIPAMYQNTVQDMAGSFAYIGVTFFFMTSAFGLKLSTKKRPVHMFSFWGKRLPKLLVPQFFTNVLDVLMCCVLFGMSDTVSILLYISEWTLWLIGCYVLFWLANLLFKDKKTSDTMICASVVAGSLLIYILTLNGIITETTWQTEIYGFIWGLLLAEGIGRFQETLNKKWLQQVAASCGVALLLGVLYLKFKPIVFFGQYLLKIVLGIAITLFVLTLNSKIALGNKAILFIGDISYEIFLVHGIVMGFLEVCFEEISSGIFILLSVVLSIATAYLVHGISEFVIKRFGRSA